MDIHKLLRIIDEHSIVESAQELPVMSLEDFLATELEDGDGTEEAGKEYKYDDLADIAKALDEAKLPGVNARTPGDDELDQFFGRVVDRTKTKQDTFKMPIVHRSNLIPLVDENDRRYDSDRLREAIKTRPKKLLKQNEKMLHSDGGGYETFYNIGLPALKGLAVDEDTDKFVIIDTCPGAGACKLYCYAMTGGYIQYPAVSLGLSRVLNFLYNDPDGFKNALIAEIKKEAVKNKKQDSTTTIRWHDAGDFFSADYLQMAYDVAKACPDVQFYAYTKIASVASSDKPSNFIINFSSGAQPREEKQIDFKKTKHSVVVPKEVIADLYNKTDKWKFSPENIAIVKDRVALKYNLDPETVVTYDEYMAMNTKGDGEAKWNVIVFPGNGDNAANRHDVLGSYLIIHGSGRAAADD